MEKKPSQKMMLSILAGAMGLSSLTACMPEARPTPANSNKSVAIPELSESDKLLIPRNWPEMRIKIKNPDGNYAALNSMENLQLTRLGSYVFEDPVLPNVTSLMFDSPEQARMVFIRFVLKNQGQNTRFEKDVLEQGLRFQTILDPDVPLKDSSLMYNNLKIGGEEAAWFGQNAEMRSEMMRASSQSQVFGDPNKYDFATTGIPRPDEGKPAALIIIGRTYSGDLQVPFTVVKRRFIFSH